MSAGFSFTLLQNNTSLYTKYNILILVV